MTEYARRSIVDRMKGAAMLDIATYEEVEHDTEATGQASVVVVIVAIGAAIGAIWGGRPSIIAGPTSTMNSVGRMKRIMGTVSIAGSRAAFSSARSMR